MALHGGYQRGFPTVRMREEDVPNTKYWIQLLAQRDDHDDIRSGTGPGSVREFLGERIQERTPKVNGLPKPMYEQTFA